MQSELAGTAGLALLLIVSLALTRSRKLTASELRATAPAAAVTLGIQMFHAWEELATAFPRRFPGLLGLASWTNAFFIGFNLTWIALWALAIVQAARGQAQFIWRALLLFLALGACANGIAHPLLAIVSRGYFPGLVSALPLGFCGVILARRLLVTRPTGRAAG